MITVFDNLTGAAKWGAIAATVSVCVGLITGAVLYIKSAEQAKSEVKSLTEKRATDKIKFDTTLASYELCELTNYNNWLGVQIQEDRAHQAELRLAAAEVRFDQESEDHQREAEAFKNRGLACPAMDRSYRLWLLDNS